MQDLHNSPVETDEVHGLTVFVTGRVVRRGEGKGAFPVYGEYRILRGATRGMVGGLGEGEGF